MIEIELACKIKRIFVVYAILIEYLILHANFNSNPTVLGRILRSSLRFFLIGCRSSLKAFLGYKLRVVPYNKLRTKGSIILDLSLNYFLVFRFLALLSS